MNVRNKIGIDGGEAIAKFLEQNTSITSIDLAHNRIGDRGGIALGSMLRANRHLTQ
jgi:hypothetical protein